MEFNGQIISISNILIGKRDSIKGRILALHTLHQVWIARTPYCPLSSPGVIPVQRARNKP